MMHPAQPTTATLVQSNTNVLLVPVEPKSNAAVREAGRRLFDRIVTMTGQADGYRTVSHPDDADVILLIATFTLFFGHVDRSRSSIRRHPLRSSCRDRCFVYDLDDNPCLFVPGVFASLDTRFYDPFRHRAGPYLHQLGNPALDPRKDVGKARYLFSFVGAPSTHRMRQQIMTLQSPRGHIVETGRWPRDPAGRDKFKSQYADSIHDSVFVLCPRGAGTSSVRLYEVLQAGRVPVIVADHWVAPKGPHWDACSVRVPESAICDIPDLLEKLEPKAAQMAAAARSTFVEWFSEDRAVGRIIDSCAELQAARGKQWGRGAIRISRQLCQPAAIKRYLLAPIIDSLRADQ